MEQAIPWQIVLFFGSWRHDPEGVAALERFNREWPYLREGREPPAVDVGEGCTLRHVFETQAGESKDQVVVDAVMGHVDSSMASVYRKRISDERLQAVVETVREWLFGSSEEEGGAR